MATPADDPTMETSSIVGASDPTMETSDDDDVSNDAITMVTRSFHRGVVSAKFEVTRGLHGHIVENAKVNIGKLYLRQIFCGEGANQSDVIIREGLGKTAVNNWAIYDGPGSNAKLVANTHGMHTFAGKWNNWFTLEFEVERFKGSTLQVMGANDGVEENDWAIVAGTGEFEMARGIISRRVYSFILPQLTQELTIEFFCRMKEIPAPTKRGPWGGTTGDCLHEMGGKSRRLESVTIYHHRKVEGLQFSYVDEDGKIHTTGTWGTNRRFSAYQIKFGPSEFVKQITGTGGYGHWVTQFRIITNTNCTYGPFGSVPSSNPFSYTVPEKETVVGFFAETLNNFITRIGVYTI